jgi:PST family polysaccharide transporter
LAQRGSLQALLTSKDGGRQFHISGAIAVQPTTPAPAVSTQPASLAVSAAHGVLWTGGGQILRQLIQVVTQLTLVRLLAPDDFGLLGMAMFFVGIGQLLADFGIGSAVVQARTEDDTVLSSCFWINLVVAGVLALVLLTASPLIGTFYRRSDLSPLIAVLSLNLLLSGLQVIPNALLYRDMRFDDLARAQVLGGLAGAGLAIALATTGAGVWALVVQPLFGTSVSLLVAWRASGWIPRWVFNASRVAPLARFSAALLGTNLVGYGNRNIDSLLIGRVLGAVPLAHYAMAIQLMLYPLQQISSVIVRVLFPALVQIQDDQPRLRAAYLKAVSTISLLTFPLMGGLFALADDFVTVAFGLSWLPMAPVLKILSWIGMMQSVGTTVGVIYLATGRPDIALRVTLIAAPALLAGFAAGLPWGITGVAIGYAVVSAMLFHFTTVLAFRLIELPLAVFYRAVSRPAAAMLVMITVLLLIAPLLDGWPATWQLGIGIAIGTLSFLIASLLLNREQLLELIAILRSLRRPAEA